MKKHICHHPGCNALIQPTERYCEMHTPQAIKPFEGAVRYNERLYNTTRWRTLRSKIIKENPSCCKCGVEANESRLEAHHIMPPKGNEELFFNESNIIVVCSACHKIITAKEIRLTGMVY
jgi:5-methylcytosine-specific restriction protein A